MSSKALHEAHRLPILPSPPIYKMLLHDGWLIHHIRNMARLPFLLSNICCRRRSENGCELTSFRNRQLAPPQCSPQSFSIGWNTPILFSTCHSEICRNSSFDHRYNGRSSSQRTVRKYTFRPMRHWPLQEYIWSCKISVIMASREMHRVQPKRWGKLTEKGIMKCEEVFTKKEET